MQQPVNSSHQRLSTSEQGSQKSAVTADLERKGKMNPNAGEFIPDFFYLEGELQCNVSVDNSAHSRQAPGRPRACTQAGGGVLGAEASGAGRASESVGLSESNVLGLIKPDTEQAKIDAHLEQQRRKAETSPSGGAAAGATAPATILIKSVWQKGPPAAVSQDAWKEGSRAPTAFSEASQGVAGADTGKEGYLNESATHSPEGWAVAKSKGKRRG